MNLLFLDQYEFSSSTAVAGKHLSNSCIFFCLFTISLLFELSDNERTLLQNHSSQHS